MLKKLLLVIVIPVFVFAQTDKIKVTGEYTYTYGDNESLLEAKSLCYTMAIRNAIESLTVYVESTASVDNYQLKNDLIQTIASGYIENLTIHEETVEGRTVLYKISGYVKPSAIKNIIQNRVGLTSQTKPSPLDNNGYLEILKIRPKGDLVKVIFKVLRNTGYLFLASEQNSKPQYRISIDYFDSEGDIIGGDSKFIHEENQEMISGQISTLIFTKPSEAKSFRVWLYKGK